MLVVGKPEPLEGGDSMHLNSFDYIITVADDIVKEHGTRSAVALASALEITIIEESFHKQKGAYLLIEDLPYIILNNNLTDELRNIVILHEIGHHLLHRDMANAFHETTLFDMSCHNMEYEANLFAAQIMLPDKETTEYIKQGYSITQIAATMNTDPNLVALKATDLNRRGLALRIPSFKADFL